MQLTDPSSISVEDPSTEITFQIVNGVSIRGAKKLYDNIGYCYAVKRRNKSGTVIWQCTTDTEVGRCSVTVKQNTLTDEFEHSDRTHLHPPKHNVKTADLFRATVSRQGLEKKFDSARNVLESVKSNVFPTDDVFNAGLSSKANYERLINRKRKANRPKELTTIHCPINANDFPPDFYRGEIVLDGARHLMFASDKQLKLLAHAKTLYVDATFKLVRKPFSQLFSIHAFVKNNDNVAQFVLVYVFMSRRTKNDYIAIFKHLLTVLNSSNLHLRANRFVLDFELAVWNALHVVFTDRFVEIMGCCFHFVQSVWRHIQEAGLQKAYKENESVNFFLKKLMGLCYLPHGEILNQFQILELNGRGSEVKKVLAYFRNTWIDGNFTPATWSVYGETIRTNNDVEG